jgi:dihydrofolate synthase/folylpolyglutamate synthase
LKSTKKRAKKRRVNSSPKVSKVKSKKPFKTYKQAISYLFEKTDYEKEERLRYNVTTFNLNRMKKLLTLVGNPHKKIATVHIAGTKGKGSTATMIARMLEANGYKVGLYTSPHVLSMHERITINNSMISENDMLNLLNRTYAPIEKLSKTDSPTFFEILTAIAFMYFIDKEVDIAVVETGLGGRLDSTNVIKPEVVGITSLSIDHQAQLGNTLAQIAKEKAGVFKAGVPIVTVEQKPEAMRVLRTEAAAIKAPLSVTGGDIDFSCRFEASPEHGPHTRICLTTPTSKFEHLRVPLSGRHQATNCALALAIVDKLKASGYEIDNSKAAKGLDNVSLLGRMEMIYEDPRILVDAAHNADSIEALMKAIGQSIPYDSMVVIFGCNNDKDVEGMLEKLQYGADKVIFTRSSSAKAMSPDQLAEIYTDVCGKMCQSASSLGEALRLANSAIGKEDLICITGSFYLIGQAKQRFKSN